MAFAIDRKKIATNTIALYIRLGITMVISFFTARVTLQQLGVDDYGLNNLVGSIVSMFSFINGSMGTAVQRFYSIEIGKKDEERLRRVFGTGLYLHIIVAIITLFLAEIFAVFFLHKMNIPGERMFAAQVVFQISVISLALNIVNVPYAALLRSREMFSKTAIVDVLQSLMRLVVLYLLVHISYDKLITLSGLNLCVTLFYVGSLFYMARKFPEAHHRPIRDKELIRKMLSFISMLLVTVLAQLLKSQGVVMLVNLFFGLAVNAAYAIASQVSNIVNSFVVNFKQSMVPQMVSSYGAEDKSAMHKIINMGTKITFLLMLMVSVPVIFEAQFLLRVWLGNPPEHAAFLVALVLVVTNISSFTYFQYQGVHATGNIMAQQIWMSTTFVVNILIIYLVFKIGASFEAALYVNMAVSVFQCVMNLYYAHKTYDYDLKVFFRQILIPCIFVVIILVSIMFLVTLLLDPSVGRFFITFFVAELVICSLGYYIILDKVEKGYVLVLFTNILKRKP
jgi:O-antigen/teichoic acid export membrane protein